MSLFATRKLDEDFLSKSYEWFENKELRRLTMTLPFTKRSQRNWYETLLRK